MLTGSQIRAARALLGWSAQQLADQSGVSYPTVQRAEQHEDVPNTTGKKLSAMYKALQRAGIVFIDAGPYQGDGDVGVRLRRD
jgi:transcriptional regulator with XRE-family HTH domain